MCNCTLLFKIVHVPVPRIQEIPQEHLAERIAEPIVPERIDEQIRDIPVPPIVEEAVDLVPVLPHERLHPRELSHHRPDEIVEAAALMKCARKTSSTKGNVGLTTVYKYSRVRKKSCGCLRNVVSFLHTSFGAYVLTSRASDAVRDLYECNQQVKRRRL